jgi:hypothetical protein
MLAYLLDLSNRLFTENRFILGDGLKLSAVQPAAVSAVQPAAESAVQRAAVSADDLS